VPPPQGVSGRQCAPHPAFQGRYPLFTPAAAGARMHLQLAPPSNRSSACCARTQPRTHAGSQRVPAVTPHAQPILPYPAAAPQQLLFCGPQQASPSRPPWGNVLVEGGGPTPHHGAWPKGGPVRPIMIGCPPAVVPRPAVSTTQGSAASLPPHTHTSPPGWWRGVVRYPPTHSPALHMAPSALSQAESCLAGQPPLLLEHQPAHRCCAPACAWHAEVPRHSSVVWHSQQEPQHLQHYPGPFC
jgi:hypothetical protein